MLLIAGLGDPADAWQLQLDGLADRYRVTAFDNRGLGRSALPDEPLSVATMALGAAAILRALGVPAAHVAGFSMASTIAQELALRHPELVRSLVLVSTYARPDAVLRSQLEFGRWLAQRRRASAPSSRRSSPGSTRRARTPTAPWTSSSARRWPPHQQSVEAFQAQHDACLAHDTADRLSRILAPTLVIAGEFDIVLPPRFGRFVAAEIPNARFEVLHRQA